MTKCEAFKCTKEAFYGIELEDLEDGHVSERNLCPGHLDDFSDQEMCEKLYKHRVLYIWRLESTKLSLRINKINKEVI